MNANLQPTHFQLDEAKVKALVETILAKGRELGIDPLALPVHVAAVEMILAVRLYPQAGDDVLMGIRRNELAAATISGLARRYVANEQKTVQP